MEGELISGYRLMEPRLDVKPARKKVSGSSRFMSLKEKSNYIWGILQDPFFLFFFSLTEQNRGHRMIAQAHKTSS